MAVTDRNKHTTTTTFRLFGLYLKHVELFYQFNFCTVILIIVNHFEPVVTWEWAGYKLNLIHK